MNINKQLRRVHNIIKHSQDDWAKRLGKEDESNFYAPYFLGALGASEILIHIWSGNLTESELERAIEELKNPIGRKQNG